MWGAEKIGASLSQSLHIPLLTAFEMMPTKAAILPNSQNTTPEQLKISDAIQSTLEPLIQDLHLTLMTAQSEYHCKIDSVDLLGGVSTIYNIDSFLTRVLNKPTQRVNPLARGDGFEHQEQMTHVFHVALGLAIEGFKRPVNPATNFRQMSLAKKNKSFERLWDKWGYTIKLMSVAYMIYLIYGVAMNQVADRLEEVSNNVLITQAGKVAGLRGGNATQSKIKAFIKEANRKSKATEFHDRLQRIQSPVELIHRISQTLPSNKQTKSYEVRKLVVKNNEINIQGVANSPKTIDSILKALKKIAIQNKVQSIPAMITKETGKRIFAFSFKVKR